MQTLTKANARELLTPGTKVIMLTEHCVVKELNDDGELTVVKENGGRMILDVKNVSKWSDLSYFIKLA